jgi:2-polyprenyl-6-methoxyphenol hydroxylase-like FAD-dependent oxidoreductase
MAVHTRARRSTPVDFGDIDSPYPFVLMLGQDQTQRILDERLEQLGVTIERGVEVQKLEQHDDRVELATRRIGEQSLRPFHVRWVVGCDGAHSVVRRHLGVPFDGDDYGQDWLMAEVDVDWQMERERFHVFSYAAAPMVCFPMPGGRWRVVLPQVPNRAGDRQAPDIQEIERLATMRGPAGMKLTDPTLLAAFRCYRRQTSVMRSGRLLVAGDAAHIHSPAGGQGMNTGLHDAANLGWKLALVVGGGASPALLDTYQDERHPIAAGVLEFTHFLVRVFTVSSPRKRWLRDRLLPIAMSIPALERRFATRLSQISHTYRGGALTSATRRSPCKSIAAGDRLPSVSGLVRGDKPLSTLDLLGSTTHTLLVLSGRETSRKRIQETVAHIAPFNGNVQVVPILAAAAAQDSQTIADPHLQAHRRYRALRGALLLVRPDGHLACRAPLSRPDIVERYLQRLTDPTTSVPRAQLTRSPTLRPAEAGETRRAADGSRVASPPRSAPLPPRSNPARTRASRRRSAAPARGR